MNRQSFNRALGVTLVGLLLVTLGPGSTPAASQQRVAKRFSGSVQEVVTFPKPARAFDPPGVIFFVDPMLKVGSRSLLGELRCVGTAKKNGRARKGVRFLRVIPTITPEGGAPQQLPSMNARIGDLGANFLWDLPAIVNPGGAFLIAVETKKIKGPRVDQLAFRCSAGGVVDCDPLLAQLCLGFQDRYAVTMIVTRPNGWIDDGAPIRESTTDGVFEFPDHSSRVRLHAGTSSAAPLGPSRAECPPFQCERAFEFFLPDAAGEGVFNRKVQILDRLSGTSITITGSEIFTDGFESGDTSALSCTVP